MTIGYRAGNEIPDMTAEIARTIFPEGNRYMELRDRLGEIYDDEEFAHLFSWKGEVGIPPGQVALVCVLQYMENLSDGQAVEAVRVRIDWKYLLGLELTDKGFDASVLSTFRERLVTGRAEAHILDKIVSLCNEQSLLRKRGRQRTDASHILGAVRDLNRLELVGESLRQALELLARAVPDWISQIAEPEWFQRYARRSEEYRLPEGRQARQNWAINTGQDGYRLLSALYAADDLRGLRQNPAIEALRQVWIQQYTRQDGETVWREAGNLPPGVLMINSPYDIEARYAEKREMHWKGFKGHVTESCEPDLPHLIVHVHTTPATTPDCEVVDTIHQALAAKDCLPSTHVVDAGYIDIENVLASQRDHQVTLIGPMRPDSSWQAHAPAAFDRSSFAIDWEAQTATCPQGHQSRTWSESQTATGRQRITVRFARSDCLECPCRSQCTSSVAGARGLSLLPREESIALSQGRSDQLSPNFAQQYNLRAGIEGTLSLATGPYDLRHARYIGLLKTHLQSVLTAAAINLSRLAAWFQAEDLSLPLDIRRRSTRTSRFAALAPA